MAADTQTIVRPDGSKVTIIHRGGEYGDEFERNRSWLETVAQQIAGRRITVAALLPDAANNDKPDVNAATADPAAVKKSALREKALADAGVQALLEVFPAEIRDVEEM